MSERAQWFASVLIFTVGVGAYGYGGPDWIPPATFMFLAGFSSRGLIEDVLANRRRRKQRQSENALAARRLLDDPDIKWSILFRDAGNE